MKKKLLALLLALTMAVSLVTPAIATEPEEELNLAETVQTLFTTLLDLYEDENAEDAGLILAALARDDDGNLPEDPELPGGFTLPELTADDLDTSLQNILTEEQLEAFQTLLDEEAQAEEAPPAVEEPEVEEEPPETSDTEEPPAEEEPIDEEPIDEEPVEEEPVEEEPVEEEPVEEPTVELLSAADMTLQETFDLLAARHAAGAAAEDYTAVTAILTALTFQEEEPQEPGEEESQEPGEEEPQEPGEEESQEPGEEEPQEPGEEESQEPGEEEPQEPGEEEPEIPLDPVPPLELIPPTCTCSLGSPAYFHNPDCPCYPANLTNEQALQVWKQLSDQEKGSAKYWFTEKQMEYILAHEKPDRTVFQGKTESGKTVQVAGYVPEGVKLVVDDLDPDVLNGEGALAFDFGDQPYVGLDIKMLDENDGEWQPAEGETVTVTMDAAQLGLEDGDDFLVYHVHKNEDGTTTEEWIGPFQAEGEKAAFELSGFSYVLVFNANYKIEDVQAFYPGSLVGDNSTNDQLTFLGVYYDANNNAHFLIAMAQNTNVNNAERQIKNITIDETTISMKELKDRYEIEQIQFSTLTVKDEKAQTIYTVESQNKGYGGIFDINLGSDVVVREGSFFGVNNEVSGNGWKIGGDLDFDLSYELIKKVATGTSASGTFSDSVEVERGDWVIYRIEIDNTGSMPLTGMTVEDILPEGVFAADTVQMSIDGENGEIGNWEPFGQTLFDNYSSAGRFKRLLYIKAQVKTDLSIPQDTTYTNTATIEGMNMPSIADTADIVVKVPQSGTLTVSKAVTSANPNDPAPTGAEFTFKIHSDAQNAGTFQYTLDNGTSDNVSNDGTFTLKNGQSARFISFPAGGFTVTEEESSGYTTKVNGQESKSYNGIMKGDGSPVVAFENQFSFRTGGLTITKAAASGTTIPADQTFLFHVTGDDVDMDVVIKGTDSVTISGLTVGNTYTVTEDTSWSWRYSPQDDATQNVKLEATGSTVTFFNKKNENNKWLSALASVVNRWTDDKIQQNPGEED